MPVDNWYLLLVPPALRLALLRISAYAAWRWLGVHSHSSALIGLDIPRLPSPYTVTDARAYHARLHSKPTKGKRRWIG